MKSDRFVILDRDGTINIERNYLSDPAGVELLPGAARGLRKMRELGLGLVVITNQSAIGRNILDIERLDQIHKRLCGLLGDEGVLLDGIYFCPHLPEDGCDCRKPRTGLLERASKELGFCIRHSYVIGDKECDILMGKNVGATTFLVLTGYGAITRKESAACPDYVVDNLELAAEIIERLL